MRTRRLGLVLVAVGVLGLIGTSVGASIGPGSRGTGWMSWMHERMMGSGLGGGQAPAPVAGAPEIEVVARDFSFSPTEVTVPAGTTVNVVVVNDGGLPHDVTIPAFGFGVAAVSGTRASASLTVGGAGRYELFCSVPGHRDAGMQGFLEVR